MSTLQLFDQVGRELLHTCAEAPPVPLKQQTGRPAQASIIEPAPWGCEMRAAGSAAVASADLHPYHPRDARTSMATSTEELMWSTRHFDCGRANGGYRRISIGAASPHDPRTVGWISRRHKSPTIAAVDANPVLKTILSNAAKSGVSAGRDTPVCATSSREQSLGAWSRYEGSECRGYTL
jgi:hypothetical protein